LSGITPPPAKYRVIVRVVLAIGAAGCTVRVASAGGARPPD
jgi:hypothetical protein